MTTKEPLRERKRMFSKDKAPKRNPKFSKDKVPKRNPKFSKDKAPKRNPKFPKDKAHNRNAGPQKAAKFERKSKAEFNSATSSKRLLRKERERLKNPAKFDLADTVKKIWEELRCVNATSPEKRKELATKLVDTVKGNAAKLVSAHDTSRVLQTLLKYGSAEQRDVIFEEMKSSFAALMGQKYSMHYLLKVLEYGSPVHRQFIVNCIIGNTRRLLKNVHAAKVVEEVFCKYAKSNEKRQLVGDICGATYRRLAAAAGGGSFRETFMSSSDDQNKDRLLGSTKAALTSLASYGKGRLANFSVVHTALDEFLSCCPVDNPLRCEVMEAWRDHIHGLLSTKIGVRCALHFVWESNSKDRKVLIKGLKPIITNLCTDADASNFIFAIFDSCDDAVLVNKYIVKLLIGKSNTSSADDDIGSTEDAYGVANTFMNPVTRRFLLYLISPRDPHHFSPTFITQLRSPVLPNGEPLGTKKTFLGRLTDLRRISGVDEAVMTFLLNSLSVAVQDLDNDGFLSLVTLINCVSDVDGKRAELFSAFVSLIETDAPATNFLSIESTVLNITLKRLVAGDRERMQEEGSSADNLFGCKLLERLVSDSAEIIPQLVSSNRGCFALLILLESQVDVISQRCRQLLMPFSSKVSAQTSPGAKLLSKKL